jgi:hypothetical protein
LSGQWGPLYIASLAKAYYLWENNTQSSKENSQIRKQLILNQDDLDKSLIDYDELRKKKVDPNAHFNLVKGWREMRRISQGNLTGDERTNALYQGMLKFVEGGTAVFNSANDLNDKVEKLKSAISKI